MDFGRLLDPFWELKWHQQIDEILDAILKAKLGDRTGNLGSAQRNARGPGVDDGGVQGCQNCWRDEDQGIRNSIIASSTPSQVAADRFAHYARPFYSIDICVIAWLSAGWLVGWLVWVGCLGCDPPHCHFL